MTTIELLNKQITEIGSLRTLLDSQDPKFRGWMQLTKTIVIDRLGEEKWKAFPSAHRFWPSHMGPWEDYEKNESLNKGLDLAKSCLETFIQEIDLLGDTTTAEKKSEIKSPRSFENIQVHGGTVIFGDGNTLTQVAVKELVNALSEEIKEKVPESDEKISVLQKLKEITTNETFATVAGTFLGEVLKRVSR